MLETIVVILVGFGFLVVHIRTMGGLPHSLLVIALVAVLMRVIQERRPV